MKAEPRSHMPLAKTPNIKQKQYCNKFNKDIKKKNFKKEKKERKETPCVNDAGR